MSNVKRVFVEKKPEFAVEAKELRHEIRHYLGIMNVTGVRVLIRYDVENVSDETFEKACMQRRVCGASCRYPLQGRVPCIRGGLQLFRGVPSGAV